MPKIKLNATFVEFRGSVNDLTYRNYRGKTFASVKADRSHVQPSPAQIAHQERFSAAAAYGKTVMADPDVRALYDQVAKERDISIFAVTVADFMNAPVINQVDLSAYSGQVSDVIKIKATDDFGVEKVHVAITNSQNGDPIESGDALETGTGSGLWLYSATTVVSEMTVNIKVVVTDRPGGTAVATFTK